LSPLLLLLLQFGNRFSYFILGGIRIFEKFLHLYFSKVDAIDYYSQMEAILEVEVKEEKDKALTKSLGIAFVTFAASSQAKLAVRIYSLWSWLRRRRPISRLSNQLTTSEWSVGYAPPPTDLYW